MHGLEEEFVGGQNKRREKRQQIIIVLTRMHPCFFHLRNTCVCRVKRWLSAVWCRLYDQAMAKICLLIFNFFLRCVLKKMFGRLIVSSFTKSLQTDDAPMKLLSFPDAALGLNEWKLLLNSIREDFIR